MAIVFTRERNPRNPQRRLYPNQHTSDAGDIAVHFAFSGRTCWEPASIQSVEVGCSMPTAFDHILVISVSRRSCDGLTLSYIPGHRYIIGSFGFAEQIEKAGLCDSIVR